MSIMLAAVLLALSLVLISCSQGKNNDASPASGSPGVASSSTNAAATGSTVKKDQTFTFLDYSNPSYPYDAKWKVWQYIKEATGVTLDVKVPSGMILADAISLAVASGDMPDLMWTLEKSVADKFGPQGAFVNILDYVNEMPNLKAWMEKYPLETHNVLSPDGKMYLFPNQGINESNRRGWMYREDIFKKLNLTTPATWDELYDTLKKLKAAYPDSYPFAFRNGLRWFYDFGASFNVSAQVEPHMASVMFDKASGEWQYAPIRDEYKTMLTYFNKFYKEGLIPKDFLTIDTKMWQDIISTNRAFVTLDYLGRIDFYNSALRKDNPAFAMNFMAPPAGWSGGPRKNAYTAKAEGSFMISSKSSKVKDIVKFVDFFYSEKGRQLTSWGKEGETFTQGTSGPKFIEPYADITDLRKKTGLSTDGTYVWFDFDTHISVSSPELKNAYKESVKYDGDKQGSLLFSQDELQILSTQGDALNSHRDENFAKFILGTRSLDEWDKFVQEQKNLGYKEIVNLYKKADASTKAAAK